MEPSDREPALAPPPGAKSEPTFVPRSFVESVSLFLSTVMPLATLTTAIWRDAHLGPQLLGAATVLTSVCLVLAFVLRYRTSDHRGRALFRWAAAASLSLLSVGWLVCYKDALCYSGLAARFDARPTIAVSRTLAWTSIAASGSDDTTLARYVDDVAGKRHRVLVVAEDEVARTEGARIWLSGHAAPGGMKIELATRTVAERGSAATTPDFTALMLADPFEQVVAQRVFAEGAALARGFRVDLSVPREHAALALQLALHGAEGALASARGDIAAATEHFDQVARLCADFESSKAATQPWLASALKVAQYFYAVHGSDSEKLNRAVHCSRTLYPSDALFMAAEAYLLARASNFSHAADLLRDAVAPPSDPALIEAVRGWIARRQGDYWVAAEHFDAASKLVPSSTPERRISLNIAAASCYRLARGRQPDRATKMLDHATSIPDRSPESLRGRLLEGYAWALHNNPQKSEEAFTRAGALAQSREARDATIYWHALALVERQDTAAALTELAKFDHAEHPSAAVLGLIAELRAPGLFGAQRYSGGYLQGPEMSRALEYARRALALDADEPRANKVLGFHAASQAMLTPTSLTRRELLQEARQHLSTSLKTEDSDAALYSEMSTIYEYLADTVNAQRTARRANELECATARDPDACAVIAIQDALAKDAYADAESGTQDLLMRYNHPADRTPLAKRTSTLMLIAISWYRAGRLDETERLYGIMRKNLKANAEFAERRSYLATIGCNLGYVYLDRAQLDHAERQFREALTGIATVDSADCKAGLAVTMLAAGKEAEARREYDEALRIDPLYRNIDVLRARNFWSDAALELARRLI